MFTPRIIAVHALAGKLHAGQTRKCYDGGEVPYIVHPQAVMTMALTSLNAEWYAESFREHIAVAALLHDVLEDTKTTRSELYREMSNLNFSAIEISSVLDTVSRLTRLKHQTITEYLDEIKRCEPALIVKRADLADNMKDHPAGARRDKYELCLHYIK